ncbi:hypothetical protein ACF0H5_014653 [Mactra antiquata]
MTDVNMEQDNIPKVFNIGNKLHEKLKRQRQEKMQKIRRTFQDRLSSKLGFFHSGRIDTQTEKEKTPRELGNSLILLATNLDRMTG